MDKKYINLCDKPKFKIHCTARNIKGEIYGCRQYEKNESMMEYFVFNEKKNKFQWINDNGYCEFEKIK